MNLLVQYYYLFTPRLAERLIWGRFINTQGGLGHNIPADLHMEHLNRVCKEAVSQLRANKTPQSISKMSRALGTIQIMTRNLEKLLAIAPVSMKHAKCSDDKDLILMVNELHKASVYYYTPG